ncbi:TraI/MobA(P) family conjugative relaxase [Chromohalobacter israelensis]|uniref:TraI/MobA(P) family conjugative relaxase n=1 Tax=Chromohalobacter israelensis TaxID=141390 RepID=UPI000557677D|nr:TraI/MobA(P) family conjugative relaxase [Chromohalobacter israelensis]MDF9435895.1 relaxase/mobilization nuclease domain-containing protein [Chromohalobacter israelensis]
MIANVCDRRRDGKSSFRTLKEYLTDRLRSDELGAEDQEMLKPDGTVIAQLSTGVSVEHNGFDLDTLVQEFESVVAMKPRVEDPIYHFVISWAEGDDPGDETMFSCAREAVERLGFGGHQYLSAIHRDTDNPHVHVAVNRVNPDTYKVKNPYNDFYTLGQLMTELEDRYGWASTPQGGPDGKLAQRADAHGDLTFEAWCKTHVVPVLKPLLEQSAAWAEIHQAIDALDVELVEHGQGLVFRTASDTGTAVAIKASAVHERFSKTRLERVLGAFEAAPKKPQDRRYPEDPQAFAAAVKDALGERIARWSGRSRCDWASLHRLMDEHGLQLTPYGQGLAISPANRDGPQMAASKLNRALAKSQLEARLGPYEPPEKAPDSAYARDRQVTPRRTALDATERLQRRYRAYRAERPTYRSLRRDIGRSIRAIRAEVRAERQEVYEHMPPGLVRAAYIQELNWQQARRIQGERLRLLRQFNAQQEADATLKWREWVEEQAKRGDGDAIQQVATWHDPRHRPRNDRVGPAGASVGYIELAPGAEALLGWERRRRRNGLCDFFTSGGERVATQQRNGLKLHRTDDTTVTAAMQLAIDTYGPELRLTGSDEFKRRAIDALITLEVQGGRRVRLTDPELEQCLEEQRSDMVSKRAYTKMK